MSAAPPLGPRLLRSGSGAPDAAMSAVVTPSESNRFSSQRYSLRSKSTAKSRATPKLLADRENATSPIPSASNTQTKRTQDRKGDLRVGTSGNTKSPQHGSLRGPGASVTRKARSAPPSPTSTWTPQPINPRPAYSREPQSSSSGTTSVRPKSEGGSISRVLKYFRGQKKASPSQVEELHKLRMLHNRLLQWRFANAKADDTTAAVKRTVEERLLRVSLRISKLRYSVAEKRIEMQRLQDGIKLYEIIFPQIYLLNEWEKLETKYSEGMNRVIRKLSAFSNNVPLLQGAKADVVALDEALRLAVEVMDNLETMSIQFSEKAENMHLILVEASDNIKRHRESAQELEDILPDMVDMLIEEQSLRTDLIQAAEDWSR